MIQPGSRIMKGANAVGVFALALLLLAKLIPIWSVFVYMLVVGLVQAIAFVQVLAFQEPSGERFLRLGSLGGGAAVLIAFGTLTIVTELLGLPPDQKLHALIVGGLAIALGYGAGFVWYYRLAKNYGKRTRKHPDFAEDAEGNPERSTTEP